MRKDKAARKIVPGPGGIHCPCCVMVPRGASAKKLMARRERRINKQVDFANA